MIGGISSSRFVTSIDPLDHNSLEAYFIVHMKCMKNKSGKALDILSDLFNKVEFNDKKKIEELLKLLYGKLQSKISSSGHVLVHQRLQWGESLYGDFEEKTNG